MQAVRRDGLRRSFFAYVWIDSADLALGYDAKTAHDSRRTEPASLIALRVLFFYEA